MSFILIWTGYRKTFPEPVHSRTLRTAVIANASAKWTQCLINAAVTGHGHGQTPLGLVEREETLATSHFLGHMHHELAVFLVGLAQHAAKLV